MFSFVVWMLIWLSSLYILHALYSGNFFCTCCSLMCSSTCSSIYFLFDPYFVFMFVIPCSRMPLSRVEDACAAMAFTRSKLRRDEVLDIYFKYSFPFDYRVILPGADMAASDSPGSSCRAVLFEEQFAAGLRFPLDPFLVEVCRDLKVALGQLYPGTIRVVLAFSEACRLRGCAPSLKVLYHFVDFRKCDGCFVFALGREGRSRIYLPCLTSRWRRRFFIVYHKFAFLHFSDGFSSHPVRSYSSPLSLSESKLAFDISSCSIVSRPILDVLVNSHLRSRWFPLEDPPRGLADLCYSFVQDLDVPMGGPDVPIADVIPGDIVVDGAPVDIPLAPAEVALPEVIVINDDDGDDSAVPVGDEAIPSLLPPLASSIVSGGVGGVASGGPVVADSGEISLGRDPDSPSRKRRRVVDDSPTRESFPGSSSAPDLVQWVEGQDPASLLNPRVLAEYIRTLAIPDDVTWFCGRPGQELSDLACFHGFSALQSVLVLNDRRQCAEEEVERLSALLATSESERAKLKASLEEHDSLLAQLKAQDAINDRQVKVIEKKTDDLTQEIEELIRINSLVGGERDSLRTEVEGLHIRLLDTKAFYSALISEYRLAIGKKLLEQNPNIDLSGVNGLDPQAIARDLLVKISKDRV
ncbi:uncharacterized protein LOC126679491 [Mercurialis annua]|uniref:uncharacterized protein LOC126679491 n=1 Tax=Mercurialis annua TaxID=3986 RepID=UPI002160DE52|nr:uncharacterized protein LOC126679491 [Mercurialis annua]